MHFVVSGMFSYLKGRVQQSRWSNVRSSVSERYRNSIRASRKNCDVKKNNWVSESVLWTTWEHLGEFWAKTDGRVLSLNAEHFIDTLKLHSVAMTEGAIYARDFVKEL